MIDKDNNMNYKSLKIKGSADSFEISNPEKLDNEGRGISLELLIDKIERYKVGDNESDDYEEVDVIWLQFEANDPAIDSCIGIELSREDVIHIHAFCEAFIKTTSL